MAIVDNAYHKIVKYLEDNGKTSSEFDNGNVSLKNNGEGCFITIWNVSGVNKPTDDQINSYAVSATKARNNEIIKRTRRASYGEIGEQLDEIYKDIDAWKARIKKIKDDNPKE